MENKILNWLVDQGCSIMSDGGVLTERGDYVTLSTLDKDPIATLIYKHKLTDLQSLTTAKGGSEVGHTVGIGFNREEQKWYGFTHRGFGSFGIGFKVEPDYAVAAYLPEGFECKTLDDCKKAAIAMSEYLD